MSLRVRDLNEMQSTRFVQFLIILCSPLRIFGSTGDVSTNEIPEVYTDFAGLEGRIVNGSKAFMGQFPHQVSLRRSYSNSHFCGGSIIAEQWVLTAAHCMFNNVGVKILPWTITVTAGHVRLDQTDSHVQKHAVTGIIVHNDFERSTLTNDIALLKTETPFDLTTTYVQAAKLKSKLPVAGTKCKVSGWGYPAENEPVLSNDLMYVDLPLINSIRCKELMANITKVPLGMFCAGYEDGLADACQGDSGGGMICADGLSGIVSGGEGCARPALPGLYADVPYYRDWVTYQTSNYNESDDRKFTTKLNEKNMSPGVSSSLSLSGLFTIFSMLHFLRPTIFHGA